MEEFTTSEILYPKVVHLNFLFISGVFVNLIFVICLLCRGEKLNATTFEGWMRERKAPALEHTLNLYHEIRGKGLKVFLISSRKEPLRDATVDNLIKVGYHGWKGLILRYFITFFLLDLRLYLLVLLALSS